MHSLPYTFEKNPITGLTNGKLGVWLFLASEVMLFGALFSAYAMLRFGATQWPRGIEILNLKVGSINTLLLFLAGLGIRFSVSALKNKKTAAFRVCLILSLVLSIVF